MFPAPSEVVTRSLLGLLQEERGLAECGVKGHTGALDAEAVAAHLRVDPRTNVSVAALLQARSDAELAGRRTAAPLALSGTATGAELELEQEQRVEALVSDLLCNITGGQTDNDAARNRWEAWAVAGREVEGVKAARVATTELGQLQRAAGQAAQVTFQPQHGYSVPPSMASRPFSCVAREGVAALLSWLLTALWQALVAVVLFVLQYPQVSVPTLLILSAGWYIRSRRRDTAAVDVIFECAQQVMRQPEVPTAGLLVGVLQAEVTRLLASSTAITRRDVARLWPRVEEALRADRALKFFVQEEAGSGANWPAVKLLSPLKVGALHMHPHARYPGQQHFGGGGGSGAGAGAGGAAGAGGLGHIFSPARQPQPAMQPQQQAAHNAGAGYAAYPYAGGLAGYAYGGGGGAAAQPAAAPDADGAGGYPTVPPAYAPIPSGVRTAGAGRAAGAFLSPAAFPDDDAGAGAGAQGKRLSYGGAVSTAFVQPPARMDSGRPGDYA